MSSDGHTQGAHHTDCRYRRTQRPRLNVTALSFFVLWTIAVPVQSPGDETPTTAEIQAMQAHLDQHGLDGFREAIAANGWQAPLIPSQWYVENRATGEDVPRFNTARHLGLTIVRKADDWAPLMLSEDGGTLVDMAVRLADVAEWVGSAYGYGNLLASYRACGAAITGLARFVADLNHPLPEIKQQLARCSTLISTGSGRGKVLNFEIADDVFPTSSGTTIEALSDFWGLRMGRIHYHEANPEEREGQRDLFNLVLSMLATAGINPDEPDPHPEFFMREARCDAVPDTTETCWDVTFHQMIARGNPSNMRLQALDRLILFRETIGHFPTEPLLKGSRFGDRNRAFDEAWDPIATSDTKNFGGAAENTLRSIEEGRFVDADMHELRLMEKRTSWTQTAAALTHTPDPPQTPSPGETPDP